MTSGLNRALNFRSRGAIRTHRIQSYDAWHGVGCGRLAGFLDFHDFAPFVVPALGAGAMRHLFFVAVWTLRQRVLGQRIVRPPRRGAFLGVSPFRIRHEQFLTWVPHPHLAFCARLGWGFYIANLDFSSLLLQSGLNARASRECLSALTTADRPTAERTNKAPYCDSSRKSGKVPCSLRGKPLSVEPPAAPVRESHLPAADRRPGNSRLPLPPPSPKALRCRHRCPTDDTASRTCASHPAPSAQGIARRVTPAWLPAPRSDGCPG